MAAILAIHLAAVSTVADDCFVTDIKPYAVSVSPGYIVKPLLSVGDVVPRTGNQIQFFQMVGFPDGLGAHRADHGQVALFMNHEFGQTAQSQPVVGGDVYRGAIVSRWMLGTEGCVVSGDLAYDRIFDEENNLILPLPTTVNATRAFARFCSGSLSWHDAGFDRPIYLTGEESSGAATFDGKGGLAVAIFDRELHTLPWMARFAWENTLARPRGGNQTVLMMMEDGPSSPDSQLYMWVGERNRRNNASALERNGLARTSGATYVLVPDNSAQINETVVTGGSVNAHWVALPGVEAMTDAQLEASSDAAGAFGFIRTEDGAFDKSDDSVYYFVTTGGAAGNHLGRLYRLNLDRRNPVGPCTLTIIYNADQVIAAGGDIALSPDNIDTSKDYIMICEDGTAQSRPVMTSKARDGSIWRFDIKNGYAPSRVVELNPPGTDTAPVTAGVWETSGVIDVASLFGRDAWIIDVQAHGPTAAPAPFTVEDGQLLLLQGVTRPRQDD